MQALEEHLLETLRRYPQFKKLLIAYSGGCDSTVLLYALSRISSKLGVELLAVHINHGLQPEADQWQEICQNNAIALNIPFESEKVTLDAHLHGGNIEARARDARYRALRKRLDSQTALLTAHHEDDQAETLLLNLLRGSGLDGLSAMSEFNQIKGANIIRPLLYSTRKEIEEYARGQNLQWIEDPSNRDSKYDRNFLRNDVLPLLQTRWPAVRQTFARSASHCSEANILLRTEARSSLEKCLAHLPHILMIDKFSSFNQSWQKLLFREWLHGLDFPVPEQKVLDLVLGQFLNSRQDAQPKICWSGIELQRYKNALYIFPELTDSGIDKKFPFEMPAKKLPGNSGELLMEKKERGLDPDIIDQLEIGFREDGLLCKLPNREGRRKLKKLLQDWQVPPWMRSHVPLLFYRDSLVAIADYAVCEDFVTSPGYQLKWKLPLAYDWRSPDGSSS